MTTLSIRQIKKQIAQLAPTKSANNLPAFWLTDWLLYVIDKPALFLITDDNYQLTESEIERFNVGVTKMQQGTPLAYLTGQQEFWSLDFKVNTHTLIPRPDTEVLVEQVLLWIKLHCKGDDKLSKRLLDLGTGSGCIAISLAHELSQTQQANWHVVAVDISNEALKVAKHNAAVNNVEIKFIPSSWYDELSTEAAQLFDVIVSNPPYIDESDEHLARLQAEPISALSAPDHGLADIEHIVKHAPRYLQADGLLAIEHGFDQGLVARDLFASYNFDKVQTVKDFAGNDRVTLGQLT